MTSQLPHFRCLFLSCQHQKNSENGDSSDFIKVLLISRQLYLLHRKIIERINGPKIT